MRIALGLGLVMACATMASAQPGSDPARADYDAAFQAFVGGDLAGAASAFDGVAARTQDPQLAASARELARLARELQARHVTLATPGAASAAAAADDSDQGRTTVIVTSTLYSVYAGIALDAIANVDDAKSATVIVMGTTTAGLVASVYATRDRRITGGMGDAYSLGMFEGAANALLLIHPVSNDASANTWLTTTLVATAAGAGIGIAYADATQPTRGQIGFASTLSLMGVATAWLGTGVVQPSSLSADGALVLTATGLDVGLAAGLTFGKDLDWSASRAQRVQLGAIVGGILGGGIGFLATDQSTSSDNNVRLVTGAALAGAWGGLALATHLTDGMRADPRYGATSPPRTTTIAPMPLQRGGGLAVIGTF